MAKTVFILGAGSSAMAGAPLMATFLDVAHELWQQGKVNDSVASFKAVFDGIDQLQQVHSKAQLDIQNLDFNGLIPGLVSKKFDMVSVGLSATPERKKSINFSRAYVPYAQILAAGVSDTTAATIAAWNTSGKTITSLQGSTAEQLVQKTFPNAKSASFPDQNAAFLEVATGRANGIVVENYLLAQFNKSNSNKLKEVPFAKPLHVEYGSYGVQKGNTKLAAGLSAFICKMQKSGQLAAIYKSTIGAE